MRKAPTIQISPEEARILTGLVGTCPDENRVRQARLVLMAAEDRTNREIAETLGVSRTLVGRWRTHYATEGLADLLTEPPEVELLELVTVEAMPRTELIEIPALLTPAATQAPETDSAADCPSNEEESPPAPKPVEAAIEAIITPPATEAPPPVVPRPAPRPASAAPAAVIEASGLTRRIRDRTILDGVDLRVASGEAVGLLGPNGAGKTTSFYIIVGLARADGGRIHLNGTDITGLPMHSRARLGIGYLPQEPSVFRKLTVAENILAVLEARPGMKPADRKARLVDLLDEFQIGHIADSPGHSLSGGERRRVEIARALATEPAFLLLDEPFAGVDPLSVLEIQRLIGHLTSRGIGILITDHNVRETLGICSRAYILSDGRVISEGTPEQLLADPVVRKSYLGEHFRM